MKFSWFLALRYLKPKRTFLSIITVISIAGVALGVGVLIVVIAVMAGFQKRIKDEWLKVEPPLYIHDDNRSYFADAVNQPEGTVAVWRELLPKIKSFPGVESASPFLNVVGLIQQARPKKYQDDEVPVGDLPPPGGDKPSGAVPDGAPMEDPVIPESQAGEGAKGAQGKPGAADEPQSAAATDGTPAPTPDADPAANPAPDRDASKDDTTEEEQEDIMDQSRPISDVMLMGIDTEDVRLMEKYGKRFSELLNLRPRPSARGEFDVAGFSIVLTENVVAKLYRNGENEFPEPGRTLYNVFGAHFIKKGVRVMQEESDAKNDPEKKAKLEKKDREYPTPEDLTITGIFTDDKQQTAGQSSLGYVSLKTAQRLSGAGDAVDGIFVDLADPYDAPAMAKKLEESGILPPGWRTETWVQRHRQQFEAVENEIGMMYIVLGFISLVAAFCIMNTMITMAVQKRREIGMMRALGAKTSHIVSLFMTKGLIVGMLGTGVGYALGRIVVYFRNDLRSWINGHFGHQIFDSSVYGLSEIPAELRPFDQIVICGIAFILCTLAAVPPALIVGRMEPARALRNDR